MAIVFRFSRGCQIFDLALSRGSECRHHIPAQTQAPPESEPFDSQSKSTRPKTGHKNELLHQILELLKPVEKSIILLLIDGFSNPEIATMLGLSDNNTRVKIHRICKKLEDHGIKDIA